MLRNLLFSIIFFSGIIFISILPSIDYQMEKSDFVNNLEKKIYTELDRIN